MITMIRKLKRVLSSYLKIIKGKSYYPERRRKSKIQIILENIIWSIKYREVNDFYFLYGFDCKGVNIFKEDYVPYRPFMKQRNSGNYRVNWAIAPLRNKFYFYALFKELMLPTPKVLEKIEIHDEIGSVNLIKKYRSIDVFAKGIDGECADKVFHVHESMPDITIPKGTYIVQEKIIQHSFMNQINSNSINTLRIVTYRVGSSIDILASVLRVGTSKTGSVDNWAVGGLCVPISNGKLNEFGFYKIQWAKKVKTHPDTGFIFRDAEIPYFSEAVEMAIRAHKMIDNVSSIGWDIAITENGPVFIEGNDNWEISLMQSGLNNGLKSKWMKSLR